ncbi:MAG: hypothetical protein CSA21_06485 [Deltaproteobacteria bacterium]|nr:MAG: hypothetical protein CSA21_06485 [Deltaproteobacteria bacterium]
MIWAWKEKLTAAVLIIFVMFPCVAGAAGYGIYEWGARGQGLGGAMVARGDDPSTVVTNPAAMTQLPGTSLTAGLTIIRPSGTVHPHDASLEGGKGEDNTWVIPNTSITTQLSETYWLGVGLYSRAGLGTEYRGDEHWFGRYNGMYAGIRQVSLNPNVAFKMTDTLSLGAGLEVAYIDADLRNMIDAGNPRNPGAGTRGIFDVKQKLAGRDPGYGFNLAVHYKPLDWLSLGISYRSKITIHMKGHADFDAVGPRAEAALAGIRASSPALAKTLKNTTFSTTEPLPAMLSLGAMIKPTDTLSLSLDLLRTYWHAYSDLTIDYDEPVLFGKDKAVIAKNWNDVNRYQLGVEYALSDWLDLRLGYVYDESPVDPKHADYQIPSSDRQIYSLGSGFHWDAWTIDCAYSYLVVATRNFGHSMALGVKDSAFKHGDSHLIALNVGYRF